MPSRFALFNHLLHWSSTSIKHNSDMLWAYPDGAANVLAYNCPFNVIITGTLIEYVFHQLLCSQLSLCCYLCAEESQSECVGLDSGQRQQAALQPVRIRRSWQQVATAVQGANGMRALRIIPYTCRWLDRLRNKLVSLLELLLQFLVCGSHIIDLGKGWGESTRKCGVLPGDTQSASMGQMSNIGHMTCQFCGLSCHLGAQDGFEVQCKARFWEEKGRKFKVKLTLLMRGNDKTSTNRTKPFIHTYTLRLYR